MKVLLHVGVAGCSLKWNGYSSRSEWYRKAGEGCLWAFETLRAELWWLDLWFEAKKVMCGIVLAQRKRDKKTKSCREAWFEVWLLYIKWDFRAIIVMILGETQCLPGWLWVLSREEAEGRGLGRTGCRAARTDGLTEDMVSSAHVFS